MLTVETPLKAGVSNVGAMSVDSEEGFALFSAHCRQDDGVPFLAVNTDGVPF